MKLRWGRITVALATTAFGAFTLPLVGLWATAPLPEPPPRVFAGDQDCATGEVLEHAIGLHAELEHNGPLEGAWDELKRDEAAIAAWRQAASCARLSPTESLIERYHVEAHVVEWAAHELELGQADDALRQALTAWELGIDQGRSEPLVGVMVGHATAFNASAVVADAIAAPGVSDGALLEAADRLDVIASVSLDVGETGRRDEAFLWQMITERPGAVFWTGGVPFFALENAYDARVRLPRLQASRPDAFHLIAEDGKDVGSGLRRVLIDGALQDLELRSQATALAAAARVTVHRRITGACPAHLSEVGDVVDVPGTYRSLQLESDLCVILASIPGHEVFVVAVN